MARGTLDQPCTPHSPHTACTHTQRAAAAHVPARRVDRGHALLCPWVGGATSVHPHACTCPSQPGGQRPRRRRRAGPQGGRPQRPQAVAVTGWSSSERPCAVQHDRGCARFFLRASAWSHLPGGGRRQRANYNQTLITRPSSRKAVTNCPTNLKPPRPGSPGAAGGVQVRVPGIEVRRRLQVTR